MPDSTGIRVTVPRTYENHKTILQLPDSVAGADWEYTITEDMIINSLHFLFTSDANPANRYVSFSVHALNDLDIYHTSHGTAITAGLVMNGVISEQSRMQANVVSLFVGLRIPENFIIYRDWVIHLTVANIQVGDTFTEINLYRKEVIDI